MKDQVTDANFPKTAEGRVYHLGLRSGELASRIITVGDPARARIVAKYFDSPWNLTTVQNGFDAGLGAPENNVDTNGHRSSPLNESAAVLELHSERGFLTLTGTYKSVPVSVVAIGMGAPNMDFFVREGREVLDEAGEGEMIVIRFGSCGGLSSLPVGSLTVPKASISVSRNYDYDFANIEEKNEDVDEFLSAYRISKPAYPDPELHELLLATLRTELPENTIIHGTHLNASADSFYSSQGRITSFPDHNRGLVDHLVDLEVGSLEMETFHLFHLSNHWPRPSRTTENHSGIPTSESILNSPPPTRSPTDLHIVPALGVLEDEGDETILYPSVLSRQEMAQATQGRKIRAAAVQMVFAERATKAFISPEQVETLQEATARGLLETLVRWKTVDRKK